MLTWMTQIFLFTNIGLLKCSICLLILRIKDEKILRRCLYVMMGGLVLTNLEPVIVLLAQCNPIEKSWKSIPHGRCWPTQVRIYSIYVQVGKSMSRFASSNMQSLMPVSIFCRHRFDLCTTTHCRTVERQDYTQDKDRCLRPHVSWTYRDSSRHSACLITRHQDRRSVLRLRHRRHLGQHGTAPWNHRDKPRS